ncbi:MAG TPA: tRNA preQ1(34) S-adenosylmethionine ribosyltransferase-isomerase QueA [Anaerolineales bacterium]|nr:tRNA preQ1(34) S-adenosylmethionine ribosyltransferase-isomerase QueA [Anaerolineales bacterium]
MKTTDFDYHLPPALIAQHPVTPRDSSRLLVYERSTGAVTHAVFREIGAFLAPGDLLVRNRTRVIRARLAGVKEDGGGKIELLLLKRLDECRWEVLVGGKGLRPGRRFAIVNGGERVTGGVVVADLGDVRRVVVFDAPVEGVLERIGGVPLPPYIQERLDDPERYQTVYAEESGSAAAPTAGLHFTRGLLEQLQAEGLRIANSTLHVGLDTFAPVREDDPAEHKIHTEWCRLPPETAEAIRTTRAARNRVVCVGTTSVRTVESATTDAGPGETVRAFEGPTDLYILPGYEFRAVDAMITNFHLPKSTLLMLVSAFAGREQVLELYELAIREGYRFYSFGDAMLIL